MGRRKRAALRQQGGGLRWGAFTLQGRDQYTTAKRSGQPVCAANGRVVGKVRDGVLRKTIRGSRHILRYPRQAIAWDQSVLAQAERLGATVCEVLDRETGTTYTASLQAFWEQGEELDRGYGLQVALSLERWKAHRSDEPAGVQLVLELE